MNFDYHGIHGFDISHWQDVNSTPQGVDLQKMKDWGARFVIIRAGNGLTVDTDFVTNWKNAKGILPRASYWYYNNTQTPKAQAYKYRDTIESDPEGVCVWDLEDRNSGYLGWQYWYDCLENFKSITGLPSASIWIYTGFYYFEEYTMSATDEQREYFKQYPLFLASYAQDPFNPNYAGVRLPRPFTHCTMLQTGTPAIGHAVGVESKEIDYDQFNGDEQSFSKYFSGVVIEPMPEPEVSMVQYKFTYSPLTNERTGPSPAASLTGKTYVPGNIVNVVQIEPVGADKWFKLDNGRYAAYVYNGTTRAVLVDTTPTPEPVTLPAYFTAHDKAGAELGIYDLRT